MTDVPIIFSAPMVRALLAGQKTMTRRLAWREPRNGCTASSATVNAAGGGAGGRSAAQTSWQRVKPGDRLWVRENIERTVGGAWFYKANGSFIEMDAGDARTGAMIAWAHHKEIGYAPSIHMPRWASRLTLVVTATKIERAQKITEADAIAEGVEKHQGDSWLATYTAGGFESRTAKGAFRGLWESLHGADSWQENPEVVALTFTVHKTNVDQMEKPR